MHCILFYISVFGGLFLTVDGTNHDPFIDFPSRRPLNVLTTGQPTPLVKDIGIADKGGNVDELAEKSRQVDFIVSNYLELLKVKTHVLSEFRSATAANHEARFALLENECTTLSKLSDRAEVEMASENHSPESDWRDALEETYLLVQVYVMEKPGPETWSTFKRNFVSALSALLDYADYLRNPLHYQPSFPWPSFLRKAVACISTVCESRAILVLRSSVVAIEELLEEVQRQRGGELATLRLRMSLRLEEVVRSVSTQKSLQAIHDVISTKVLTTLATMQGVSIETWPTVKPQANKALLSMLSILRESAAARLVRSAKKASRLTLTQLGDTKRPSNCVRELSQKKNSVLVYRDRHGHLRESRMKPGYVTITKPCMYAADDRGTTWVIKNDRGRDLQRRSRSSGHRSYSPRRCHHCSHTRRSRDDYACEQRGHCRDREEEYQRHRHHSRSLVDSKEYERRRHHSRFLADSQEYERHRHSHGLDDSKEYERHRHSHALDDSDVHERHHKRPNHRDDESPDIQAQLRLQAMGLAQRTLELIMAKEGLN